MKNIYITEGNNNKGLETYMKEHNFGMCNCSVIANTQDEASDIINRFNFQELSEWMSKEEALGGKHLKPFVYVDNKVIDNMDIDDQRRLLEILTWDHSPCVVLMSESTFEKTKYFHCIPYWCVGDSEMAAECNDETIKEFKGGIHTLGYMLAEKYMKKPKRSEFIKKVKTLADDLVEGQFLIYQDPNKNSIIDIPYGEFKVVGEEELSKLIKEDSEVATIRSLSGREYLDSDDKKITLNRFIGIYTKSGNEDPSLFLNWYLNKGYQMLLDYLDLPKNMSYWNMTGPEILAAKSNN